MITKKKEDKEIKLDEGQAPDNTTISDTDATKGGDDEQDVQTDPPEAVDDKQEGDKSDSTNDEPQPGDEVPVDTSEYFLNPVTKEVVACMRRDDETGSGQVEVQLTAQAVSALGEVLGARSRKMRGVTITLKGGEAELRDVLGQRLSLVDKTSFKGDPSDDFTTTLLK